MVRSQVSIGTGRLRPERGLVERACELHAALGLPVRMKMIKVLGSQEAVPPSVSEVGRTLQISQPTATKHLAILHRAGFVRRQQVGSRVHYALDRETVAEYEEVMKLAFHHATTPCVNSFDCDTCPFAQTCI
ncbi:winged helix-turn-helix transcriptional regulator [Georgenia yuyongxinii]|uniref:Winged helix-turn-helix transcriptional regulator n=1 Tax=Georgenia yuyongxinii TaxID=2589797 RepID=A0A5B8C5P0_9MICO|nr:metalloregulator ArsR/SmtB family transcription factor [Georgenia yuyongxinii]QDC24691.1 winged helix-turn-helix transcriptional regulator [Georgenia yuyongxinii]